MRLAAQLAVPLALALSACIDDSSGRALREQVMALEERIGVSVVERIGPGRVLIRWPEPRAGERVVIYAGPGPEAIDRSEPVAETRQARVAIDSAGDARTFYEVNREDGKRELVAERRVPFEGASNFRDLGGYATTDGRRVRWGRLYRSDDLSELTEADVARLERVGLRLVIDLRSPNERAGEPDRLPKGAAPDVVHLPVHGIRIEPVEIRERIRTGKVDGIDFDRMLVDANADFVREFDAEYAAMLGLVAQADALPTLVHCTAGKDRAGFATAVVLMALGVPRETILYDYMLTNAFTAVQIRQTLRSIYLISLFRTDPELVEPVLQARPHYLQAAFDAIDQQWGSPELYLQRALGLDESERARLQNALLVDPSG